MLQGMEAFLTQSPSKDFQSLFGCFIIYNKKLQFKLLTFNPFSDASIGGGGGAVIGNNFFQSLFGCFKQHSFPPSVNKDITFNPFSDASKKQQKKNVEDEF